MSPTRAPLRVYHRALYSSAKLAADTNLALIAAGVAFFAMLSIFPALAALIAVLSLIANPVVVIAQLEEMCGVLPQDVCDILNAQIIGLINTGTGRLGWASALSLAVALWSARAGVGAMMSGLNTAHGHENRSSVSHYIRALILTVALVAVGIVALMAVVVAPVVLAYLPLGPWVAVVAEALRLGTAVVVIFAGVGMLYRYGPNRKRDRMSWVSPGAALAVLSWAGLSYAFSYYVANFGNYNEVYGSIGAVIAMLIWLWISSFLVLFGAALNAELERRGMNTHPERLSDAEG